MLVVHRLGTKTVMVQRAHSRMQSYTNLVADAMEGAARPTGSNIRRFPIHKDTCG